jgi:hypothetical protein
MSEGGGGANELVGAVMVIATLAYELAHWIYVKVRLFPSSSHVAR